MICLDKHKEITVHTSRTLEGLLYALESIYVKDDCLTDKEREFLRNAVDTLERRVYGKRYGVR